MGYAFFFVVVVVWGGGGGWGGVGCWTNKVYNATVYVKMVNC